MDTVVSRFECHARTGLLVVQCRYVSHLEGGLFLKSGSPQLTNVAAHAVLLTGRTNITDRELRGLDH